jgi:hypothetical protein
LEQVRTVLTEYASHLPLTIRQVFYRLVGAHGFAKTEHSYKQLGEHLNRGRRAGLIAWEDLRDDGVTIREPHAWDSVDHLIRSIMGEVRRFRLDRQKGQPRRLIFAVEAQGMVPQIERIAAPYGIAVHSSGGFDSVTAKHALAERLGEYDAVEVLHLGDHDPSGIHQFLSMADDVETLAADLGLEVDIKFTRLGVTPEQIRALRLPAAPAKPTDRRRFDGATVQLEAIPPDVLAGIVRQAIEVRLDRDTYQAVLAAEETAREGLTQRLQPLLRDADGEDAA